MNADWPEDLDVPYRFKVMDLDDDQLTAEQATQTDPGRRDIVDGELSFRAAVASWQEDLDEQLVADMAPAGRWGWLRGRWGR